MKLVEYTNEAVVMWYNQERVSLNTQTYALNFSPVRHWDHGEYLCLANDRRIPEAIIHLIVQGTTSSVSVLLLEYYLAAT